MASGMSRPAMQDLSLLMGTGTVVGMTDAELLGRIRTGTQEASEVAFTALLERHGRLVLGVCRHFLRQPHDVEDAFQATFLVLVRKASSVRVDHSLAPWLYGVATRVAHRARTSSNRLKLREGPAADLAVDDPECDAERFDLRPVIHEEVNRLPEKYRVPVVLCHLEGKTHEEAARQLRCPVGTVSGRLSRARQLLRSRLARRGLNVPAGVFAAQLVPELGSVLPPSLVESTVRALSRPEGAASLTAQVSALARGALNAMWWKQIRLVIAIALVSAAVVSGVGVVAAQLQPSAPRAAAEPPKSRQAPASPNAGQSPAAPTLQSAGPLPRQPIANPPGGIGNGPGLGIPGGPRIKGVLTSESIVTADSADGRSVLAMSVKTEKAALTRAQSGWKSYLKPPGLKVRPLLFADALALSFEGGEVTELAVFSALTGDWSVQKLRTPVKSRVSPIANFSAIHYLVDDTMYVYSVPAGKWGQLVLRAGEKPTIAWNPNAMLVQQGTTLHVFNLESGVWADPVEIKIPEPSQLGNGPAVDPRAIPPH